MYDDQGRICGTAEDARNNRMTANPTRPHFGGVFFRLLILSYKVYNFFDASSQSSAGLSVNAG